VKAPGSIGVVLVAALACVSIGCRVDRQETAASRPALQVVSLPDLSRAAVPVQEHIRTRFGSLQAALDRADVPPAELANAFGEMGKLFIAAEFYDQAQACLANAQLLRPGEMQWPYLLGHVFRFRNEIPRAEAAFAEAVKLAPNHVPSLVWLAEMHLAQSEADQAEPLLIKAQSLDAQSGAVRFALGRLALARHDYKQAVTHLEAALARGPQATRIHYPLALAYRGLGDRRKAEEHLALRGELDLPPADPILEALGNLLENAAAYETRGSKAIEARQWPEAVANLQKAVSLEPGNALTHLNLGTALYMQGDADGALTQYRAATRLSPSLAKAHFGIGVILETRNQDGEAIQAFTTAVASDPASLEARFGLAQALRRNGRVEEALPHYEYVLQTSPAASQAAFGLAIGLVRLGRYQEARVRLERAAKAFPDQPGFAHALARVLAAAPDDRVRDGARAVSIMAELLKTQRTLAMAETMAMALAEIGRFDEAVKWQQDAIASASGADRGDLATRLTVNLRRYQARQPCRVPWTTDDPVHHPSPATQ
jgi:tetratricopeptide (TPR) repeat protein